MGLILRGVWFVLIGWWLAILWVFGGLLLIGTIVFAPVGLYVLAKTWAVATLKTNPQKIVVEAKAEASGD